MKTKIIPVILSATMMVGCTPTQTHLKNVRGNDTDRISTGKVQKEIRVGMTSGQVVEALGSPNIVTTDDQRRQQWVYDKIATETAYSTSSGGFSALVLGFSGNVGGGVGPGYSRSNGASSTSQRTLTVIVKFDNEERVRDFAYHSSSF